MTTDKQFTGYSGLSHTTKLPCCVVSIADLRKLYNKLQVKTLEVVNEYLDNMPKPDGLDPIEFEDRKKLIRNGQWLMIIIIGANGEQIVDQSVHALDEEQLPEKISSVVFDSFTKFQQEYNVTLINRFKVTISFANTPSPWSYNPWNQPTPNNSVIEVIGSDQTWVTGLHVTILEFFNTKSRRRNWLHSQITFGVLNWIVGIPGALWIVYRINAHYLELFNQMNNALSGAISVYLFLIAFLLFRGIIHGFRWLFPLIELEGAQSIRIRGLLSFILGSLLLALVTDIVKALFF